MLTSRSKDEDTIAAFGQGADDYVAKPFSVQVLVNRVKAVLRRAKPQQWPAGSPDQIAGKGVRLGALMAKILCVDDDRHLVGLLRQALEREGFVVLAAHNGWDALRLAWEERPDLVVLDVSLPGMSGFDVLPMLRSFSPVPVIMLTGGADNVNRRADLMGRARFVRGADDYVAKPFSPDVLIRRIRALLRERTPPR
jgi:DNA-binding response OmpR family regulator